MLCANRAVNKQTTIADTRKMCQPKHGRIIRRIPTNQMGNLALFAGVNKLNVITF